MTIYSVKVAIYSLNRKGDSKLDTVISLGEMSMEAARGAVSKFVHDNPSKKFVTTYEETLFQNSSDTCNQQCLDCPLFDDCNKTTKIVSRETSTNHE